MVNEELPQLIAYPLGLARERLIKEGYDVSVVETLPPGQLRCNDYNYRVVRQRLLRNKLVELAVTIDFGRRG